MDPRNEKRPGAPAGRPGLNTELPRTSYNKPAFDSQASPAGTNTITALLALRQRAPLASRDRKLLLKHTRLQGVIDDQPPGGASCGPKAFNLNAIRWLLRRASAIVLWSGAQTAPLDILRYALMQHDRAVIVTTAMSHESEWLDLVAENKLPDAEVFLLHANGPSRWRAKS